MGFAISWLAVRGNSETEVLATLGLEKTGETDGTPDSDWCMTHAGEWTIVWSDKYEPGKFRGIATKLTGDVVIVDVEEHVMVVSASAYKSGALSWRIIHDAQQSHTHLAVEGTPPDSYLHIRDEEFARVNDDLGVDYIFEVPVRVAQELVGFRHDAVWTPEFEILRIANNKKPRWVFW